MCIDYRELHKLTTKNLLRIDDLFEQLQVSCYFSKIDIRSVYHQLRVYGEDILKTKFMARNGHFKFTAMPFGLTNTPAVFMVLKNQVCKPYLNKFFILFIDDILIYSKSKEAYKTLVRSNEELKVPKMQSGIRSFLGFIVYYDALNQGLGCVLMQRGKVENTTTEMLRGLNQLIERKKCGGANKTYYDLRDMYGGHVWRRILLPMLAII
uniref:Putative reverse transcriptase domain-containing protein n=1 Tax=Tanacetum cinerariifolium TaxID=118510 RepID=A0A6L2N9Y9_TANCI|nr:putative reverse transcriptase domain-containing protein [Tanacetum cinerariifolium]